MKHYLLILAAISPLMAAAQSPTQDLAYMQRQWAVCQYQVKKEGPRESCFTDLVQRNRDALTASPDSNELKTWLGINLSSLAGVKGGIGALSLVKEARKEFEQVIDVAPKTLSGSALTSLGALYYQVPGWPIGFGDKKKARAMLKAGVAANPDGLDSNYFYADFLLDQDDERQAKVYFEKALKAPARPNRPIADAGRRAEIQQKLKELD